MVTTQAAPPAYSSNTTAKTATTTDTTAADATKKTNISSDFETFLRMLTVQMQNQDPLNPVDSSDYAVQLATFSSVEQQVLTNDLLRGINDKVGGGNLGQLANWVGMEALVRAPVAYDGRPVNLRPEYADTADAAALVVRDASDALVARSTIPLGEKSIVWDGKDDTGAAYPNGVYKFSIESYQNGKVIDTATAQVYSAIQEARVSGNAILLRLSDGTEVDAELVTGLRSPD
ncbi:hypothetical protein P775_02665 [Puniceibacterium antarcticum]|uniref:Basal-body rod modification protein FlgD n=1 Tax=Puniceibacterium antarcticum TaxID=1206336 RepID=A0A2G8RL85_9RHOB|nr:flagellar hook capping FlgD N-terminal domain-containing protein [Puniceibacterium antarcticum]PIL21898.1 hypothetical protein P775_02665 [Puniceibacterium antarcticum]